MVALGNDSSQERSHTFTGSPRREVSGKNPKIWWKAQRMSSAPPSTNHKCSFCILHMELIVLKARDTKRNQVCAQLSSTSITLYDSPWPLPLSQLWILFKGNSLIYSFDFHSKVGIPNSSSSTHPQMNSLSLTTNSSSHPPNFFYPIYSGSKSLSFPISKQLLNPSNNKDDKDTDNNDSSTQCLPSTYSACITHCAGGSLQEVGTLSLPHGKEAETHMLRNEHRTRKW